MFLLTDTDRLSVQSSTTWLATGTCPRTASSFVRLWRYAYLFTETTVAQSQADRAPPLPSLRFSYAPDIDQQSAAMYNLACNVRLFPASFIPFSKMGTYPEREGFRCIPLYVVVPCWSVTVMFPSICVAGIDRQIPQLSTTIGCSQRALVPNIFFSLELKK